MKLGHAGIVATGTIVVLGVVMIAPAFTQHQRIDNRGLIMISFDISFAGDEDASTWCKDLVSMLARHNNPKATVFVTGKIAEANPECVTSFSSNNNNFDVGSQTYSYADLVSLNDYTKALDEIQKGKHSVDKAGHIDSKLFRAPYGQTNQDIYSLLARSDITADFSYVNHYNTYEGQGSGFIKHDLKVLPAANDGLQLFSLISYDNNFVSQASQDRVPLEIIFDNSMRIDEIDKFLSEISADGKIRFVNASDIVGTDLTAERRLQ